ncbi:MAG: glutamate synthase subunit alpha, partial [Chloroflexi bacterium]
MLCVDPEHGGLEENDAIKTRLAAQEPYGRWLEDNLQSLDTGEPDETVMPDPVARQSAFGYTKEEFTYVLRPMATQGKEPIFSMGDDTALSVLAQSPRLLYSYFKQRFAQVTNPPIDHLRERLVMSLRSYLGPPAPLLSGGPDAARLVQLDSFLLYPSGLDTVRALGTPFASSDLDASFDVADGASGLRAACERLAEDAERAARLGASILIVTDRDAGPGRAPIPALLAVGTVHHHLMRRGLRGQTSLVVETDEAREVHHVVCLLGYGAQAICPRLGMASIRALASAGHLKGEAADGRGAQEHYVKALEDGTLKVLAKMGISTLDGYQGAQIFEVIGLDADV